MLKPVKLIGDQTGPTWQASGVSFAASSALQSALLSAAGPAEISYQPGDAPPWSDEEWRAAQPIWRREIEAPRPGWSELRRQGEDFYFAEGWGGSLLARPGAIYGYAPHPEYPLSLEMEFMEAGLGLHLGQRGVPVFHGATLEIDGAAIGLLAVSGNGKSSLTVKLAQRGCGFLSDDSFAVHGPENLVWPSHFQARLHADSAAALLRPDQHEPLRPWSDRSKRVTRVDLWARTQQTPCPLKALYVVAARAAIKDEIKFIPLQGHRALHLLIRARLIPAERLIAAPEMARLSALANAVPIKWLLYPRDYAALDRVADAVIADAQASIRASEPSAAGADAAHA